MHHPIKKQKVMSFIKSQKCDVVFMQERHLMPEEAQRLRWGWMSRVFTSCRTNRSRDVITLNALQKSVTELEVFCCCNLKLKAKL